MSLNVADKVFLYVGLVSFVGIIIWIAIALYIAYTKMDLMLRHFKNSSAVMIRAFLINAGPWGRMHVFGLIMGLMVMPGVFVRKGAVSTEDLKNFPVALKHQLAVMLWVGWGLLSVVFGLFVLIKIGIV